MKKLIENEITLMWKDIEKYFLKLSQLPIVIYPYDRNTTKNLIEELSEKFGLHVDMIYYHCDDKSEKSEINGIPVLPLSDLLNSADKNYMYILGNRQDWQLDFWCLEWNKIPCKNMINLSQLDFYSMICDNTTKTCGEDADEISENLNACEKAYELMSDEKSKKIFLRMLAKRITGCNFYFDVFTTDQYFNRNLIGDLNNEVFFDVGSYDGATIKTFIEHCENYKSIYAFEPDNSAFSRLYRASEDLNNLIYLNMGLSDTNGEIPFFSEEYGSSHILGASSEDTCGKKCSNILSIKGDSLNLSPTFIKMDIEGSEIPALNGLKETIRKQTPKLAICLYHHLSDLWNIPLLIHNINKDYSFKIAHHSYGVTETVLYAVNRNGAL